jgi:hypothetical protein
MKRSEMLLKIETFVMNVELKNEIFNPCMNEAGYREFASKMLEEIENLGMLPPSIEDAHSIYGDSCNISFGNMIDEYCIWEN